MAIENSHSSNTWVFPSLVFRVFNLICRDYLVEVVLVPVHPVPLRTDISSPVLQKLPWRKFRMISRVTLAEGCRNDLNEFKIYFDINFARQYSDMHFSDSQTTQLQLKSLRLWIWTRGHKALMKERIIRQFVSWPNRNHQTISSRIFFSDPILSSGWSCVKPRLPYRIRRPMWHSMSFSPAKKGACVCLFSVDNRAAKHCHSTVGCLYFHCFHVFHVFIMFSHFSDRSTSWSSPCFDVFSKGVHL